ncbi:MAG TPA: hypothetical protein VNO32_05700, partial [Candidatus Acidoferrum sp.]|nr:hypothetical protein [Candidatus Acidoferrum sp.]
VTEAITVRPVTAEVAVATVAAGVDRVARRATAAGIPLGEGEEAIPAGADTQEAEVIVSPSCYTIVCFEYCELM